MLRHSFRENLKSIKEKLAIFIMSNYSTCYERRSLEGLQTLTRFCVRVYFHILLYSCSENERQSSKYIIIFIIKRLLESMKFNNFTPERVLPPSFYQSHQQSNRNELSSLLYLSEVMNYILQHGLPAYTHTHTHTHPHTHTHTHIHTHTHTHRRDGELNKSPKNTTFSQYDYE